MRRNNSDIIEPSLSLLCKLGSIIVHADEATKPCDLMSVAHHFDIIALRTLLDDPEVKDWIKGMGELIAAQTAG